MGDLEEIFRRLPRYARNDKWKGNTMIEKMPKWMYAILKFFVSLTGIKSLRQKLKQCRYPYPRCSEYKKCCLKRDGFEKCKKTIQNLVIGSSHGDYAYIPAENEYNFCIPSQDLYYASKIYEKYDNEMPKLQNVVLFYSVFSPGFCLEKTSEKYRCLGYYKVFDIMPQTQDVLDMVKDETRQYDVCLNLLEKETKASKSYRGENEDKKGKMVGRIGVANVEERAEKHLKNNRRGDLELQFLKNLIEKTAQNNHRLFIILAPAHKDYKKLLPDGAELFASLKKLIEECDKNAQSENRHVMLIDLYNHFDLPNDCWWDYDHVNHKGAEVVTSEIRKQTKGFERL